MDMPSFYTIQELAGLDAIPDLYRVTKHLVFSSPATLAYNSPGAEGFGVKRAGLAIPESVMLIVSPGCCGRNTSQISSMPQYQNRFFYLQMDETDLVTGRHLKSIPQAICEIVDFLEVKPALVMICATCADAKRREGPSLLHVCADERGHPSSNGSCQAVFVFSSGKERKSKYLRESAGILLTPVR